MKKKTIIIIIVIVAVAALGGYSLMGEGDRSIQVQAAEVKESTIVEKVSASGRIQPKTKVDITSEINGEIIYLPIKEGASVVAGQLLVVLDTVQLASDVSQAGYALDEITARLSGSKTLMDQNKEEYDRQQRMFDQNLTSETEFKNARYAYLTSEATYNSRTAEAKRLESAYSKQLDYLDKTKIVAPMTGVVTFLDVEVGEIAAAQTAFTQGRTLMTISDLTVFEVDVEVDETEISKVELGQKVSIEVDAIPDTLFDGEVVEIGNTAILEGLGTQDQSTNFKVLVTFLEPYKKLRPGMSATVDITTAKRVDALAIPFSSVVIRNYDLDSLSEARADRQSGVQTGETDVQAAENGNDDDAPPPEEQQDGQEEETTDTVPTTEVDEPAEDNTREDIKGVFVVHESEVIFMPIETGVADQKNIEVTFGLAVGDSVVSGPYRILRTIRDGETVTVSKQDQ